MIILCVLIVVIAILAGFFGNKSKSAQVKELLIANREIQQKYDTLVLSCKGMAERLEQLEKENEAVKNDHCCMTRKVEDTQQVRMAMHQMISNMEDSLKKPLDALKECRSLLEGVE